MTRRMVPAGVVVRQTPEPLFLTPHCSRRYQDSQETSRDSSPVLVGRDPGFECRICPTNAFLPGAAVISRLCGKDIASTALIAGLSQNTSAERWFLGITRSMLSRKPATSCGARAKGHKAPAATNYAVGFG